MSPTTHDARRVNDAHLERFIHDVLARIADTATADAATRAMMHGSRLGIDSHGARLLQHYVTVMEAGRVNPRPALRLKAGGGATAVLDGDDGHGALAAYRAMDEAVALAAQQGIGAVAIRRSSHFGPAGAYALAAAERGYIGLAFCNSDSFVRLHEGRIRFHGTNPIAAAAPVVGSRPGDGSSRIPIETEFLDCAIAGRAKATTSNRVVAIILMHSTMIEG
ncbi:MAG: Ldh family oxidoreductase [Paracoccus sp. (in: a-proteobacteria)]